MYFFIIENTVSNLPGGDISLFRKGCPLRGKPFKPYWYEYFDYATEQCISCGVLFFKFIYCIIDIYANMKKESEIMNHPKIVKHLNSITINNKLSILCSSVQLATTLQKMLNVVGICIMTCYSLPLYSNAQYQPIVFNTYSLAKESR